MKLSPSNPIMVNLLSSFFGIDRQSEIAWSLSRSPFLSLQQIITSQKLMAFLYASYANDANKQRSTTGFVFTYCGGAIAYKSRTQSITTISSTKAEFPCSSFVCQDCSLFYVLYLKKENGVVLS